MERPLIHEPFGSYALSLWEGDANGAVLYVATGDATMKPRLSEEALAKLIEQATAALAEVRVAKKNSQQAAA